MKFRGIKYASFTEAYNLNETFAEKINPYLEAILCRGQESGRCPFLITPTEEDLEEAAWYYADNNPIEAKAFGLKDE